MSLAACEVGIRAIELYFPKLLVEQRDLEEMDNCQGKYTIGLGQQQMGVAAVGEDVNSILLTVTKRLMDLNQLKAEDIGFLEVGSETILDKSKSSKTVLMQLFQDNPDIAGVDCRNACFGCTAAIFNAVNWMESSAWDGRLALVVGGDVAVYDSKEARPTGGCGAVAILIGPNAPIIFDQKVRAYHMEHVYDFYKGNISSEYPQVDGHLSLDCYLRALDQCYAKYKSKAFTTGILSKEQSHAVLNGVDYCLFHSPYSKLVEKAFCRLIYLESRDFHHNPLAHETAEATEMFTSLQAFSDMDLTQSRCARDLQTAVRNASENLFREKVEPSLKVARHVGNCYTASLYAALVSLLNSKAATELAGKRALLYSYGSGLTACMFSVRFANDANQLHNLVKAQEDLPQRLQNRSTITPEAFLAMLDHRDAVYSAAPYTPDVNVHYLFPQTFYLHRIDEQFRRFYELYS